MRNNDRKRAANNLSILPEPDHVLSSSAANFSRQHTNYRHSAHTATPPASAFFPLLSANSNTAPRPTPDAQAHFSYSTSLRRHPDHSLGSPAGIANAVNAASGSIFERIGRSLTRKRPQRYENNDAEAESAPPPPSSSQIPQLDRRDTLSARFAHSTIDDTIAYFRTSADSGLLSRDIPALQAKHGFNEFDVSAPEPVLLKFAKTVYESPLILLLCGSAAVSAIMGNVDDAISITVAVLIVLTVGFVQERRSEKSLEALNKLVPHHCHVIRDGQSVHVLANDLVPGDVITFSTGDRIPADIRVITAIDLEIDESSLTGETEARRKDAEMCQFENRAYTNGDARTGPSADGDDDGRGGWTAPGEPVALADRTCIAYMGTLVRNGRGAGVVVATGTETEFGVIFSMMQDVDEKRTPLQLSMDELAKKLSIMSFGIIGVICLIGVLQKRSWLDMFTIGVSLAVAAIPEGLPIVTTVTLALGVLRMSKRKAIVKKLHSVEALGSVSVICSDKTGTLTKNEQTVVEAYAVDETVHIDPSGATTMDKRSISHAVRKAMEIGALCNNASLTRNEDGEFVGQSTDVALLNVMDTFDLPDPRQNFTRLSERPFNSEQKYMAVSGIHTAVTGLASSSVGAAGASGSGAAPPQREMYYIKGSIEAILERCRFYYVSDESTPGLDANTRNVIAIKAQTTAARGLRVIAMAYGYGAVDAPVPLSAAPGGGGGAGAGASRSSSPGPLDNKKHLVFVGFQAMIDPPRKGVADSIGLLQSGGVQIVMITGDAEETALSIAQKLGLRVGRGVRGGAGGGNSTCLTGKAIDLMSKAQLRERVGSVSVFARTTPRHKMAIVEAFQARGAVVAMTGDGVNDAPALKMADIGVSMGKSGTDVSKEAADVILVDDNFSTILPAVEEGKSIFHNIQNFLSFQLSTAAAALTLITLSTMFGLSNPLNAMQILFINILMDGPPSQSLGVDPVDPAIMQKPPRKKDEPIITRRLLYRVLFSASMIVIGTLLLYIFALSDDHMSRREQTMTFTGFVFLDLVSAIQSRGLGCGLTQNKILMLTVSVSFMAQLGLVYVPFMQAVFQTEALSLRDLLIILGLAAGSMVLHEGRRTFERKVNAESTYTSVMEEMV